MKFFEYTTMSYIQNTSFSSKLTDGHKKLKCFITLGWKVLPGTNTKAYWTHFASYEENEVL
jgi:hypothetical protein